jgi:hypothetical protein
MKVSLNQLCKLEDSLKNNLISKVNRKTIYITNGMPIANLIVSLAMKEISSKQEKTRVIQVLNDNDSPVLI